MNLTVFRFSILKGASINSKLLRISKIMSIYNQIGISLGVIGLWAVIVNGLMIEPFIRYFGIVKAILLSSVLMGVGNILFAVATEGWMMYIFMLPYILGGICEPAIQSLISNKIPQNEQGEVQGALTGLISLSSIVGPPVMSNLFSVFANKGSFNNPMVL